MNKTISNLASTFSNLHVSLPVAGAVALKVAGIWFPAIKPKLDATAEICLSYGIIAASNSGPQQPKQ